MTQSTIKILITEDHALVRKGLKSLISSRSEFQVVGEADNGLAAIEMTRKCKPDLILLDLSMPKMNGLATMRQLKKERPEVKILVITMHASQDYLIPALKEGADGYLLKGDDPQELFMAIRAIMDGKAYLSSDLSGQLIHSVINPDTREAADPLASLTQREKEVFQLVAEGNTNQQIADLLFISPKTVDKHRTNLMKKLDLHSAREVSNFALKNGIILNT
ncbi:two component transcriptional regulator, LuxR family [Desulfatibacillum aliphaticivorans]|uniref:Two component transcriptional regulator, LuxR family n=1 Tax=Desulfatibacillum aliphaticivorans TaxID=218208 RepID=B8FDP3_DESAL|nr:response regulator transcription factor [Desulfatibacillum aliphaticivorans]ACL06674.1 two component transcriptional regulator, LuxR family [Desulfatibacillum aliphaticivorans]